MIETKHTPGPWAWQKFGGNHCLTAQHGLREIIIGANPSRGNKMPVVVMNNDGILYPVDPGHSNAKLIAASPDLLEALIELESFAPDGVNGKPTAFDNGLLAAIMKAKEAIKKATV
jgi:hypothetical protein